ncbi:hypothetical protein L195_g064391, partial [Trifolium pratense]
MDGHDEKEVARATREKLAGAIIGQLAGAILAWLTSILWAAH